MSTWFEDSPPPAPPPEPTPSPRKKPEGSDTAASSDNEAGNVSSEQSWG